MAMHRSPGPGSASECKVRRTLTSHHIRTLFEFLTLKEFVLLFKRIMPLLFIALATSCTQNPIPTAIPSPTVTEPIIAQNETTPVPSFSPLPSFTPLFTATTLPTFTPTSIATVTPTGTPSLIPTNTLIPSPTATEAATPTRTFAETCRSLTDTGPAGLFLFYISASPELKWDLEPRAFRVGVCNSHTVPTVPESDFILSIRLVDKRAPLGQTPHLPKQLEPGFSELTLSPWTPGLENHVTICVQRAIVALELGYSDQPGSRNYRPVQWLDGSTSRLFPVKCGGDYS